MKKNIFLILLILSGCTTIPSSTALPTSSSSRISDQILASFEFDSKCPHMCWLGINPGKTTQNDAIAILRASEAIDQGSFVNYDDYLSVIWFMGNTREFEYPVTIVFENGAVKSIGFANLIELTINDLFKILGKPDEINISYELPPDGPRYIRYIVYYPRQKIRIDINPAPWNEPNPQDVVRGFGLNQEYPYTNPGWSNLQPWLGFGHLKDYLPGVEIPTAIPSATP